MKRFLAGAVVAALACGCGQRPPPLAGGKPVAHWVEAAKGPDARARKEAVFKLGNVGPADPAAFPAVVGALDDRDAAVRRAAILAVLKFGARAQDAEARLAELAKRDADAKVRSYAAKALERLHARDRNDP